MWSVYSWITTALSPTMPLIRCKCWQGMFCQTTNFVCLKHRPHSWQEPLLHTLLRFLMPWGSNLPSLTWSVFLIIKSRCCCKNCSRSRCCFEISLSSHPFLSVRSITCLKRQWSLLLQFSKIISKVNFKQNLSCNRCDNVHTVEYFTFFYKFTYRWSSSINVQTVVKYVW